MIEAVMIAIRIVCAAIAMLMTLSASPASPPEPPTKQALALAWRSIAVSGGVYALVRQRAFVTAWRNGATPAAWSRLHAARGAIAMHRAELEALNGRLAAGMARDIGIASLQVLVRFVEGPAGRSILRKTRTIFDGMPAKTVAQPSLTDQEWAALSAFESTPEARSLKAKANGADELAFAAPLLKVIERDTDAIYCRDTKTCPAKPPSRTSP